ncbi:MAG: helix-turn-helix transcriptional regulator [Methylocystis sp.]|uniref:helix-turn-helix transcriptional regulator n=1 Tax=Methylocystis sp. TaxID=1911079 RepID=UPI003DA352FA
MTPNNIRALREKKGISQKKLAKAVETDQRHIQRIEAGVQKPRFDLAVQICLTLDVPMEKVFPTAAAAIARARRRFKMPGDWLFDDAASNELEAAAFDMDPEVWRFLYKLHGGASGCLIVSGPEKKRLWRWVQEEEAGPHMFVVFDSEDRRYAMNLDHLMFCQFLFDPPFRKLGGSTTDTGDETGSNELVLYFADSPTPQRFEIDPDLSSSGDEEAEEHKVQLQQLFGTMEYGGSQKLHFVDVDGESVFVSSADVSMLSMPLSAVEPTLREAYRAADDEENDDQQDDNEHPADSRPCGRNLVVENFGDSRG